MNGLGDGIIVIKLNVALMSSNHNFFNSKLRKLLESVSYKLIFGAYRPQQPKVSVIIITYNHSNYISSCLEGVLKQITNFTIECLVGDDFSSDGTSSIISNFEEQNKNLIFHIRRNTNLGQLTGNGRLNLLHTLSLARGKFIAICDGDDFWTDPYKLQKQVDYLEANPNCSFCTHWVKTRIGNDEPFDEELVSGRIRPQIINSNDMFIDKGRETLKGIPFMSLSVVARKKCFEFTSKIIKNIPGGDNAIWVNALEHGYAYCIPEHMGVYRKHGTSTWSSLNSTHKSIQILVNLLYIKKYYPKYSKRINLLFTKELKEWSEWDFNHNVYKNFTKSILHFIGRHPLFSVTLLKFLFFVSISYFYRNLRCIIKQYFGLLRRIFIKKII